VRLLEITVQTRSETITIESDFRKEPPLPSDVSSLIIQLQQQRDAIDRALSALRDIGGNTTAPVPAKKRGRPPGSKFSAEARRRMSEAQKRRYAEKKAPAAAPAAKKRGGLTAAGRKRLSRMMKARWASKKPPKKRTAA
jgi:hypothetical protein